MAIKLPDPNDKTLHFVEFYPRTTEDYQVLGKLFETLLTKFKHELPGKTSYLYHPEKCSIVTIELNDGDVRNLSVKRWRPEAIANGCIITEINCIDLKYLLFLDLLGEIKLW